MLESQWEKNERKTNIYRMMQSDIDFVILWMQQVLQLCQYRFQFPGAALNDQIKG